MTIRNYFLIILFTTISESAAFHCERTPDHILKPRNRNEIDKYVIEVSGNPESYVPEETYNVSLKLNSNLPFRGSFFKEFILVVEHETADSSETPLQSSTGNFKLIDDVLTKFSKKCPNTLVQTNSVPKRDVKVSWMAPPSGSGCVFLRATVVESGTNWYSDDGGLTKRLCEEQSENEDIQPPILKRCCACDEAKYEIAFQGMWSRNTHAKYFPENLFSTKFSDLIGSSHKLHSSFWSYNHFASEGLKDLAQTGNTKFLEAELREESENIRTIIKARELAFPNLTGTTYTVFRVDRQNHLVSVVSKITPSPDWFVGVSSLELCLKNCSWVESRILNLYPWDAGTMNGLNYTSVAGATFPPHTIRRITSNSPNDPASPFFDDNGEEMKPLARLHLTRQKIYEKTCDFASIDGTDELDDNCDTTDWSAWSPCSLTCTMYRQRNYTSETAIDCKLQLVQERPCPCDGNPCELTEWSDWSSCSVSCGNGTKTRDRELVNQQNDKICNSGILVLQENEPCEGNEFCDNPEQDTECPNTEWGEWSPCNVTCGTGHKKRFRTHIGEDKHEFVEEDDEICPNQKHMEVVECYKQSCEEQSNEAVKWGDMTVGNQILSSTQMPIIHSEGPVGEVTDCKVSKWSTWSHCNVTQPCKRGFQFKERYIKVHAQNGGKSCPKKLQKKRRCQMDCDGKMRVKKASAETEEDNYENKSKFEVGSENWDCQMSRWTQWSPCNSICGASAIQLRTRNILVMPSGNGRPCGPRLQEKRCPLPLACSTQQRL